MAQNEEKDLVSRRKLFQAGGAGLGALLLAGFGKDAVVRADDLSGLEKANLEIVHAYDKNMSDATVTLDDKFARMKDTCVDDLIYGQANGTKVYGLPAVQKYYEGVFKGPDGGAKGLRTLEYEYSKVFVHGPVIAEYGLHFITPPGGPKPAPTNFHCVVYIIKDGKIVERYDNFVRNS